MILALLAVTAIMLVPDKALAQGNACHAAVPAQLAAADVPDAALEWHCDSSDADLAPSRIALRFEGADPKGQFFETRIGQFEAITLISVDREGKQFSQSWRAADISPQITDRLFALPLPLAGADATAHFAVFDRVEHPSVLAMASIVEETGQQQPDNLRSVLVVAMIAGFLLLPILVDLAFFRALQARFLLWHAALALSMAVYLLSSGILAAFLPLSVLHLDNLTLICFSATTATGLMFFSYFIEPDKMHPRVRQLLGWSAILIMAITAVRLIGLEALRPFSVKFYFSMYLPILALLGWAMIHAARHGSRAVWFQIVAWAPLVMLGVIRIASMLGTELSYIEGIWLFRLGAAFEVLVSAMGIVDRVITIKRERDTAQAQAAMLESLSERDPLTGLLNRRAIETRFTALTGGGFDTVAVIDLDLFKSVNDTHGHAVGDEVLRIVARALQPDAETLVVRLGGEEFALILRGENAVERAEQRRQAITLRVAAEITLDWPVTASMGVIHAPGIVGGEDGTGQDFEMLYQRADKLLYEAKGTGRNRMVCERLQLFPAKGKDERRRTARRAAA